MRNNNKKIIKAAVCVLLLLTVGAAVYCFFNGWLSLKDKPYADTEAELLEIKVLDVGDANSIIITYADKVMLVDVGREINKAHVKEALDAYGADKIDILVITHAHYDHYGGVKAFGEYKIDKTYISPYVSDSNGYEFALDYISERCDDIEKLKYGDSFTFGDVKIEVLGPVKEKYEEINDTSLILKLTYEEVSVLLPADAEGEETNDSIEAGGDLRADVMLVSHHGSNADGANSYRFLNAVLPDYAVISCAGEASEYGYPHEEVLSRFKDLKCALYRTDLNGDITIKTDGKKIEIITSK